MKKLSTIFLTLLISITSNAQKEFEGATPLFGAEQVLMASSRPGTLGTFFNAGPSVIEGNTYLFDDWDNKLRITINEKQYLLNNINFNIKTNNFESKIKDSLFVFDGKNMDFVHINNRKFQKMYSPKDNKNAFFEVIYDCKEFQLIKDYRIEVKKAEVDPLMIKKNRHSYKTDKTYYIKDENGFKSIKLKKKTILALFKDRKSEMKTFIKENKLSVKKDKDLKKMFYYYCNQ